MERGTDAAKVGRGPKGLHKIKEKFGNANEKKKKFLLQRLWEKKAEGGGTELGKING